MSAEGIGPAQPPQDTGPGPGSGPEAARAPRAPGGKRLRIGDALLQEGVISKEQLEEALRLQKTSNRMLGELLIEQGVVSAAAMVRALASALNVRGVQLRHGLIDQSLLPMVGADEAERLRIIPMFKVGDELTVAMAEPQSLPAIDRLRQLTGCRIRAVLALESNILEYVRKYRAGPVDIDEVLADLPEQAVDVVDREQVDDGPATKIEEFVQGSPIVNLVNKAFLLAVRDKASDIHIEPEKRATLVRYRVDGVLRQLMKLPAGMHAAVVSRVKVIGKMDIAEKRLPQEGRVRIVAEGREIDLRVSSMPTLLGEKIVVRVLDKSNLKVTLEDLGFREGALQSFCRFLKLDHGLALVTGPTGSGKTTTLYSALDLLRNSEVNLLTVEDPVEYQLDMVNQIQVNEQIGLTFARALRSILRQDPDVIMVGEVRDQETAKVAVQAALTGHLVLATLHTNDAPGCVARLVDMGIEPYLLSSALNGAVAQRLARTICPACATRYYPTEQVLADAGLADKVGVPFRKGAGCQACHDSGYKGRTGIYEVFEVTPELRRMIHHARPTHELRECARRGGALSLREEGVIVALDGRTNLEEVLRVTQDDDAEAASLAEDRAAPPAKEAA